jgi:hypothetical protein
MMNESKPKRFLKPAIIVGLLMIGFASGGAADILIPDGAWWQGLDQHHQLIALSL